MRIKKIVCRRFITHKGIKTELPIGTIFGRLKVISYVGKQNRQHVWRCACRCGQITDVPFGSLNGGNKNSCGCAKMEACQNNGKKNRVHGLSKTQTGKSWQAMINRCYNKNQPAYPRYGGSGKIVCEYLRASPINLIELIGLRPPQLSLDRTNNNGSYTCGKCAECLSNNYPFNIRWATRIEQNRNRSDSRYITVNGFTKHIRQWAEECGMSASGIEHRINAGKTGEELVKPKKQ